MENLHCIKFTDEETLMQPSNLEIEKQKCNHQIWRWSRRRFRAGAAVEVEVVQRE